LTAEGQKRAEDKRGLWTANGEYEGGARGLSFDSHLERPLQERCLGWTVTGPPMVPGAYNNNVQLFQTPDSVAIVNEMVHEFASCRSMAVLGWVSRSGCEWATRVAAGMATPSSSTPRISSRWCSGRERRLHLIERFKRVDAETLLYEFTVDDPATWTGNGRCRSPCREPGADFRVRLPRGIFAC
jgi:hypothetical protein